MAFLLSVALMMQLPQEVPPEQPADSAGLESPVAENPEAVGGTAEAEAPKSGTGTENQTGKEVAVDELHVLIIPFANVDANPADSYLGKTIPASLATSLDSSNKLKLLVVYDESKDYAVLPNNRDLYEIGKSGSYDTIIAGSYTVSENTLDSPDQFVNLTLVALDIRTNTTAVRQVTTIPIGAQQLKALDEFAETLIKRLERAYLGDHPPFRFGVEWLTTAGYVPFVGDATFGQMHFKFTIKRDQIPWMAYFLMSTGVGIFPSISSFSITATLGFGLGVRLQLRSFTSNKILKRLYLESEFQVQTINSSIWQDNLTTLQTELYASILSVFLVLEGRLGIEFSKHFNMYVGPTLKIGLTPQIYIYDSTAMAMSYYSGVLGGMVIGMMF